MPKITKQLIEAFNADNLYHTIDTNFTLERSFMTGEKIVIKFDKDMTDKQCMDYLRDLRSKIIKRFCLEEDAGVIFDVRSFPINLERVKRQRRNSGGIKYAFPVDEGVLFNFKSYLISSFAGRTGRKLGEIFGVEHMENSTGAVEFDHEHYLYSTEFGRKRVADKFTELFKEDIAIFDSVPRSIFEIDEEGSEVSIKDIFKNNPRLIESMAKYYLWGVGRDLQTSNEESDCVQEIKDRVINFVYDKSDIRIDAFKRESYLNSGEDLLLIPIVSVDDGSFRFLKKSEMQKINKAFSDKVNVLNNINKCISQEQLDRLLEKNSQKRAVYGINLYDREISCCVLNKIIENSVVNKDYKLFIDYGKTQELLDLPKKVEENRTSGDSGVGRSPEVLRRTSLTASQRKELRSFLSPELQKKLDSGTLGDEQHLYLMYTHGGKRELHKSIESEDSQALRRLEAQAQLTVSPKQSSERRDSGFCSGFSSGIRSSLMRKEGPKSILQQYDVEQCAVDRKGIWQ